MAHERIAKEEAVGQVEDERLHVADELATERAARQQAEQERDETTTGRQEAEERLHEIMAAQVTQKPSTAPDAAKRGQGVGKTCTTDQRLDRTPEVSDAVQADGAAPVTQTRRRGWPPKVRETESGICGVVETGVEGAVSIAASYTNPRPILRPNINPRTLNPTLITKG